MFARGVAKALEVRFRLRGWDQRTKLMLDVFLVTTTLGSAIRLDAPPSRLHSSFWSSSSCFSPSSQARHASANRIRSIRSALAGACGRGSKTNADAVGLGSKTNADAIGLGSKTSLPWHR